MLKRKFHNPLWEFCTRPATSGSRASLFLSCISPTASSSLLAEYLENFPRHWGSGITGQIKGLVLLSKLWVVERGKHRARISGSRLTGLQIAICM